MLYRITLAICLFVLAGCAGVGGSQEVLDDELVGLDWDVVDAVQGSASLEHPCDDKDMIGCPTNPAPKGTVFKIGGYELTYEGTNVYRWTESKPNPFADTPRFSAPTEPVAEEYVDSFIYAYTAIRVKNIDADFVDLTGGLGMSVASEVDPFYDLEPCSAAPASSAATAGFLQQGEEAMLILCNVNIAIPGYHSNTAQMNPGQIESFVRLPNCGWYCVVELDIIDQSFDTSILETVDRAFDDEYLQERWGDNWPELEDWFKSDHASDALTLDG